MTDEFSDHDLRQLASGLFGAKRRRVASPDPDPEPEPRRLYVAREGRHVATPRADRDMREFARQLFGNLP